jgi:hypothetical protein
VHRYELQKSESDLWSRISPHARRKNGGLRRVNGGLARSERRRSNVGERFARKDGRESPSCRTVTAEDGEGPGWRESAIQSVVRSPKAVVRSRDRGVMATGSYEGSSPMEGVPGQREASTVTSRRGSWPWQLLHPPTLASTPNP